MGCSSVHHSFVYTNHGAMSIDKNIRAFLDGLMTQFELRLPGRMVAFGVFGSLTYESSNRVLGDLDLVLLLSDSPTMEVMVELRRLLEPQYDEADQLDVLFCHAPVVVFENDKCMPNTFLAKHILSSQWVAVVDNEIFGCMCKKLSEESLRGASIAAITLLRSGLHEMRMVLLNGSRYQSINTEVYVFKYHFYVVCRAILWLYCGEVILEKQAILEALHEGDLPDSEYLPRTALEFEELSRQFEFRHKCLAGLHLCIDKLDLSYSVTDPQFPFRIARKRQLDAFKNRNSKI